MKALVVTRYAGIEGLSVQHVGEPTAKPGQVLIKVGAAGLNFADVITAHRGYPGTPPPPLVAGREFAGVEDSTGRRVMGYSQWGAFAEKMVADPSLLWPIPEHWTDEQAAAFPVNYFTAYLAFWQAGLTGSSETMWGQPPSAVRPGEARPSGGAPPLSRSLRQGADFDLASATPTRTPRVLIHAVAGGVGTAAVQIGHILGVEMFGTSSSDEKLARVKELGLEHGINYKLMDYEEAIKQLTHSEGVDVVFEMLGGEHTAKSLRCLRDFGRVIQYGTAAGKPPQLDVRALHAKSAILQGLWLTHLCAKPEIMQPAWSQLSAWISDRKLAPVIGQVLPLERAAEAYNLLIEGKNFGKVVLKIA